jgi:phytoene dehydrogenase-like protein
MNKSYDIIIIGGGHNGLTAATSLAKTGKKVLVLEKRNILGGIAAGEEFYPGYKTNGLLHDTTGVRAEVIKELNLEKFGLQTRKSRPAIHLLSKDGKCLELTADVESTCSVITKFSQKDAIAYREYRSFIGKIRPFVQGILNDMPLDLSEFGRTQIWKLAGKGLSLKKLGKATMMELLKVAPMSVADFLNERFETNFIKAGIAAPAIYGSFTGPWSSYTTLNLLMWECSANESIVGGPEALVKALEKAARDAGVEVRTNAAVDKIVLDKNANVSGVRLVSGQEIQSRQVASSATPRVTFYDLLEPAALAYSLEHAIQHYRSRGTTAKVNLALNKPLMLNGASGVVFARTGNSFDEMEKAFDPAKYRKFSDEPLLDIHVPSAEDPSLAPAGCQSVSILVHFVPHHFDEGWSDVTKEKLLKTVIKTLSQYAPDLSSSIIGSEVMSPVDLEQRYGLTNGHIFHGEHAIDQMITRPVPQCAQYSTPIPGLYLCGSGSHPGGGITCMPGFLSAKRMMM